MPKNQTAAVGGIMSAAHWTILLHLCLALCAGGLIGLERSRRGRMAGLREHALVSLGSAQLMMIGVYSWQGGIVEHPFDGTSNHVIQGVMSGIGFLGAGGILKEGFSLRGLTTAASLWCTATIGLMIGLGFLFPALATTTLTLLALTILRWCEGLLVDKHEIKLHLRQNRADAIHEPQIVEMLAKHRCAVSSLSAQGAGEGRFLDYQALISTPDKNASHGLIEALANDSRFIEFSLTPVGDF
jgi:putative Mg2+ transporter-C (MgtC) family protein